MTIDTKPGTLIVIFQLEKIIPMKFRFVAQAEMNTLILFIGSYETTRVFFIHHFFKTRFFIEIIH